MTDDSPLNGLGVPTTHRPKRNACLASVHPLRANYLPEILRDLLLPACLSVRSPSTQRLVSCLAHLLLIDTPLSTQLVLSCLVCLVCLVAFLSSSISPSYRSTLLQTGSPHPLIPCCLHSTHARPYFGDPDPD
jgi:hypothetical protein